MIARFLEYAKNKIFACQSLLKYARLQKSGYEYAKLATLLCDCDPISVSLPPSKDGLTSPTSAGCLSTAVLSYALPPKIMYTLS